MSERLNILNVETGEVKEESQREMVMTAFKFLGEATDWEAKERIEKQYGITIDERNWVSARRGDLISEGLIEATELKRVGEFGKPCTVWRFNPDGKKHDPTCLTSNQMARIIKYLNDKCRVTNSFQRKQMLEVITHHEQMS